MSHSFFMLLLYSWIILALVGYFKTRKQTAPASPLPANKWLLIFNSAVLYAIAFNVIFFIQELFLTIGKYWLGLKAVLYHNNHNWFDFHPKAALAQGYGAVSILITAVICGLMFFAMRKSSSWVKVLLFWMAYSGFMQSLPQFATAVFAGETDTGQAFTYLQLSTTTGYIFTIVGGVLIIAISMLSSRYLLEMSPSPQGVQTGSRRFNYVFKTAILAGIVGILLIFPFRIPPFDRALAPVLVTLISVPWIFANAWRIKNVHVTGNEINHKLMIAPIVILVVLLFIFQLILRPGVVFQP